MIVGQKAQPWQVPMPRLSSRLDVHTQEYRDNAQSMAALVEDLRREVGRSARGGSKAAKIGRAHV